MPQSTVSIAFQTDQPLAVYGALAQAAEDYGFDGVTVYNDMLYQPAWLPLLEIRAPHAAGANRAGGGSPPTPPFTCHPINIAGNIALLDEASQGRAYLGLARGGLARLRRHRAAAAGGSANVRRWSACATCCRSRRKPYRGEVFQLAGGDALALETSAADIPLLLGSWGAQTNPCLHPAESTRSRLVGQPTGCHPAAARRRRSGRAGGRPCARHSLDWWSARSQWSIAMARRAGAGSSQGRAVTCRSSRKLDHTLDLDPALLERTTPHCGLHFT